MNAFTLMLAGTGRSTSAGTSNTAWGVDRARVRSVLNFFTVSEIVSRDREFEAIRSLSSSGPERNRFPVTTLVGVAAFPCLAAFVPE